MTLLTPETSYHATVVTSRRSCSKSGRRWAAVERLVSLKERMDLKLYLD